MTRAGYWLALREPLDAESCSEALAARVLDAVGPHEPLRFVDLATGTGSNIRYFMDWFSGRRQRWLAIDHQMLYLPASTYQVPIIAISRSRWLAGHVVVLREILRHVVELPAVGV